MERAVEENLKQDGEMKWTWNKRKHHREEWQRVDRGGDREGKPSHNSGRQMAEKERKKSSSSSHLP